MKKLLTAIILLITVSSCSRYTGERTSNGCGVWFKKNFTGEGHPRREKHYSRWGH